MNLRALHSRRLRLRVMAVALLATALLAPAAAAAQDGRTAVALHLEDVLVLSYWSQIEAEVDVDGGVTMQAHSPRTDDRGGEVGLAVNVPDARTPSAAPASGTLERAFDIHSLSRSGMVRVSMTIERPIAEGDAGARVVALQVRAIVDGLQGQSVDFAGPGLSWPVAGALGLTLDLTAAREGGWYRGIVLRLAVENL